MRQEDQFSINVCSKLYRSYEEFRVYDDHLNIVGIFFHEIVIYLTNLYLLRNSSDLALDPIRFPYVNKLYVENPPSLGLDYFNNLSSKRLLLLKVGLVKKFIYKFFIMLCQTISFAFRSKSELCICGFFEKGLFFECLLLSLKYKITFKLEAPKIFIPERVNQLLQLEALVKELLDLQSFSHTDILAKNFRNYVESLTTTNKIYKKIGGVLVTGSLTILPMRILAALARCDGVRVVAFSHGQNSFSFFNEPILGYGELSYCDYYVDYGDGWDIGKSNYVKVLPNSNPKIVSRSSKIVKQIYASSRIAKQLISRNTRICYIPNLMGECIRYGPFRDVDFRLYRSWQEALNLMDLNISFKLYPGSNLDFLIESKKDYRKLHEVVDDYDVFIFDYLSTAHSIVTATNKQCIYFDIGMRNISPDAFQYFEERVNIFKIDLKGNYQQQISQSIINYNINVREINNRFTKTDSISSIAKNMNFYDIIEHIHSLLNK